MQLYDQRERTRSASAAAARRRPARRAARRARASASRTTSSTSSASSPRRSIANFVSEYAAGRTPIPCVHCNGDLKFATLAERAGASAPSSSRPGTTRASSSTRPTRPLPAAARRRPGQGSVVLPVHADQAQLAHAMFPVGDLDKAAVREHARELGLSVAEKPDSHEICFVADGDHAAFLERHGRARAGRRDPRTSTARSSASTRASTASRSASARASASPRPFRLYVVGIDAAAKTRDRRPARGARARRR